MCLFKAMRLSIHREGFIFIILFLLVTIVLGLFSNFLGLVGLVLSLWCCYFFRDPERVVPIGEDLIVSPADGVIQKIEDVALPSNLTSSGEIRTRVSIFLNVFNVHVNRVPAEGKITKLYYHEGKFFNASLDKASEFNERQEVLMQLKNGDEIAFSQIAGLIARRSINPFIKWFQNILRVLNISKEDHTKTKISELTKDVCKRVNTENYRSQLILEAKVIIDEMKLYDLLDNLVDTKKLNSLSDKSLYTLLKMIATDLSLNGLQCEHPYRPSELAARIDSSDAPKREETIKIITTIVEDYVNYTKKTIIIDELKKIKATKSEMQVINFERDSQGYKKDSEIIKLHAEMRRIKNNYFIAELAHSIARDDTIVQSTLGRTSKYLSESSNKSKFIEEQILKSFKPHAHLLFEKLTNADDIGEFKKEVVSMIKTGKVDGFAEKHLGISSVQKSPLVPQAKATRPGSFLLP